MAAGDVTGRRRSRETVELGLVRLDGIRKTSIANSTTDFFSAGDIQPPSEGFLHIEVKFDSAQKLEIRKDLVTGGPDVDSGFTVALVANEWTYFIIPVNETEKVQFRHDKISAVTVTCNVYFYERS